MYLIAWAVVNVENTENWKWFVELLSADLNMGSGDGWTLISDKQKRLEKCIKLYLHNAEHRIWVRHIYSNWRNKHKGGVLKKRIWQWAKSYSLSEFEENLGSLRAESEEAAEDLLKIESKHWRRTFFNGSVKCDVVDNNLSESFNKWILDVRHKPIIIMLEEIRCMVMERITTMAPKGDKFDHDICPSIMSKVNKNIKLIKDCKMQCNVTVKMVTKLFK